LQSLVKETQEILGVKNSWKQPGFTKIIVLKKFIPGSGLCIAAYFGIRIFCFRKRNLLKKMSWRPSDELLAITDYYERLEVLPLVRVHPTDSPLALC
jgi:hypothetical protein